jgi:hypothetical protein
MKARTGKVCTKTVTLSGFGFQKSGLSYKSARKLPQKRKIFIIQEEFGKIIDVVWRRVCFLTVYMGDVSLE